MTVNVSRSCRVEANASTFSLVLFAASTTCSTEIAARQQRSKHKCALQKRHTSNLIRADRCHVLKSDFQCKISSETCCPCLRCVWSKVPCYLEQQSLSRPAARNHPKRVRGVVFHPSRRRRCFPKLCHACCIRRVELACQLRVSWASLRLHPFWPRFPGTSM